MAAPNVLVMTGYGINCDEETKFAFEKAGAKAKIVHINDLTDGHDRLSNYQILAFPGGFSYGDDTGSGNAFANRVRNNLWEETRKFVEGDHLAIGICNGFQIMVNLGLVPALCGQYGDRQAALAHNDSARYHVRWVDLEFGGSSPWTTNIGTISVPVAHGEGKFYVTHSALMRLKEKGMIAAKYVSGEMCQYQNLPPNPNGSLEDVAGILDESGRLIGMMPHPERAIDFTHLPNWPLLKEKLKREGKPLPAEGPGMKIFRNAVEYFK